GAQLAQHVDIQQMVVSHPLRPFGPQSGQALAQRGTTVQFGTVALAVVEADGLDVAAMRQRPGQAGGGILPAGKQDQGAAGGPGRAHAVAGRASRRFMMRTIVFRATPYIGTNSSRLTVSLMA